MGRSNVGKSSLINRLAGTNVAYTSKTPGKTRTLNFLEVETKNQRENIVMVDAPGYGFAQGDQRELK